MNKGIETIKRYNMLFKENNDIYRKAAKSMNLPESTLWILYIIRLYGKSMTQKELCDVIFMPKQSVNTALKKIEADGYISLEYAENNRKSKLICITAKGEELCAKTADKVIDAEKRVFSQFTEEETEFWFELYKKYNDLIKDEFTEGEE